MIAIAIFGVVMVVISLFMIVKPEAWVQIVLRFVRMPYMHPIEIIIRLGFGLLFIQFAEHSKFPLVIKIVGYVLLAVGIGLMLMPPSFHRRLALWAVEKVSKYFRPAGFFSLAFGVFLIYAAV